MFRSLDRWKSLTASAVIALQLASLLAPAAVRAEAAPSPSDLVTKGQQAYDQARFQDAIDILKDLVNRADLSKPDLMKAREYLARTYVKAGKYDLAKDSFKSVLTLDPTWRPDPVYVPPDEIDLFNEALKEYQASPPPAPAPSATPSAPETQPQAQAPPPQTPAEQASVAPQGKPLYKKWWVWAAGVAVVGGAAALAGGGSKSSASPLPGFPGPPGP